MKIFYRTSLFFLTFLSFNIHSQITIGQSTESKKDTIIKLKNDIKHKREMDGSTEIFFGPDWSKSYRKLIENSGLYGDPLGLRADEISYNTWSYNLGFRNYFTKHFAFEGGISFLKNGESYKFKGSDSTYNYQTTYSYIAMPLKMLYCHGDDIRFIGGAGIIPQMFYQYRQEQQWTTSLNESKTASIKTKNDYNSFVLSAVVSAGIQIRYSTSWSIYIIPEYRWQLNSSYIVTDSYKHYARTFGINFGFVYQL